MRRPTTVAVAVAVAVLVAAAFAPSIAAAGGVGASQPTSEVGQFPDDETDDGNLTDTNESVEETTDGTVDADADTDTDTDVGETVTETDVGETVTETEADVTNEAEDTAATTIVDGAAEADASGDVGVDGDAADAAATVDAETAGVMANVSVATDVDAVSTTVGAAGVVGDGDGPADDGSETDDGAAASADDETDPAASGDEGADDEASSAGADGDDAGGESERQRDSDASPLAGLPAVPLGGRTGAGAAAVVGGAGLTAVAARSWLAGGASGAGSAQTAVSTAAERSVGGLRSLVDRLRYFVGLGYSRYDDSDPLEHETRADIQAVIREEPGVHLSAVAEATDAPLSTVRHHLDVLADEGLVYDADLRGRRRYFPAEETDPALQAALADEATAAVVEALDGFGPAAVGDLAEAVDRDRSTLSHHLDRLEEDGVVERERDGRAVVNRLSPTARATLSGATVETGASDASRVGEGAYVPSDD